MKKILTVALVASLFAVSCSKPIRGGADDILTQQKHAEGPDDNPHGGGQQVSVPAAVLAAFNTRYPDAKNIEWKQESNGNYKAEFLRGSVKWEATFTAAGKLVKEEHN